MVDVTLLTVMLTHVSYCAAFRIILVAAGLAPVQERKCVDVRADARDRIGEAISPESLSIAPLGDLDGDGVIDLAAFYRPNCGTGVGCMPNLIYLRRPSCVLFVGAINGDLLRPLSTSSHGLHDLLILHPGLFEEEQTRLSFDGRKYREVARRTRRGRSGLIGNQVRIWTRWTRIVPAPE
jgi:hypothetical protein